MTNEARNVLFGFRNSRAALLQAFYHGIEKRNESWFKEFFPIDCRSKKWLFNILFQPFSFYYWGISDFNNSPLMMKINNVLICFFLFAGSLSCSSEKNNTLHVLSLENGKDESLNKLSSEFLDSLYWSGPTIIWMHILESDYLILNDNCFQKYTEFAEIVNAMQRDLSKYHNGFIENPMYYFGNNSRIVNKYRKHIWPAFRDKRSIDVQYLMFEKLQQMEYDYHLLYIIRFYYRFMKSEIKSRPYFFTYFNHYVLITFYINFREYIYAELKECNCLKV